MGKQKGNRSSLENMSSRAWPEILSELKHDIPVPDQG